MTFLIQWLQEFVATLFASDPPVDPLDGLSPRERADLPAHHPLCDG